MDFPYLRLQFYRINMQIENEIKKCLNGALATDLPETFPAADYR